MFKPYPSDCVLYCLTQSQFEQSSTKKTPKRYKLKHFHKIYSNVLHLAFYTFQQFSTERSFHVIKYINSKAYLKKYQQHLNILAN